MKITNTEFTELFIIENTIHSDLRGDFIKIFNSKVMEEYGLNVKIKEIYYSTSKKNVLRGMHFQTPPYDHAKFVQVINGQILDVVIDIRKSSKTFGKCFSIILSSIDGKSLYIPTGFAHGYLALEDNTTVLYQTTSEYSNENDQGLKYSSIPFKWPIEKPIISERDRNLVDFSAFNTPF